MEGSSFVSSSGLVYDEAFTSLMPEVGLAAATQTPGPPNSSGEPNYTLKLEGNADSTLLAAVTSSASIVLYDLSNSNSPFNQAGVLSSQDSSTPAMWKHSQRIRDIQWSFNSPDVLVSGGDDGLVFMWDRRSGATPVGRVRPPAAKAGTSIGAVGLRPDDLVLAAAANPPGGADPVIHFFDTRVLTTETGPTLAAATIDSAPVVLGGSGGNHDGSGGRGGRGGRRGRKGRPAPKEPVHGLLGSYEDSHAQWITSVEYGASNGFLATAGEDGLVCIWPSSEPGDEDACESVLSTEQSVASMTWFGDDGGHLACLTQAETLSLWNPSAAQRYSNLESILHAPTIEYYINCTYDTMFKRVWALAGSHSGALTLMHVNVDALNPVVTFPPHPSAHTSTIRDAYWRPGAPWWVTCGEEGRICMWSHSAEIRANTAVSLSEFTNALTSGAIEAQAAAEAAVAAMDAAQSAAVPEYAGTTSPSTQTEEYGHAQARGEQFPGGQAGRGGRGGGGGRYRPY